MSICSRGYGLMMYHHGETVMTFFPVLTSKLFSLFFLLSELIVLSSVYKYHLAIKFSGLYIYIYIFVRNGGWLMFDADMH